MKNRPTAHAVDRDTVNQVGFSGFLPRTYGTGEKTERVGFNDGVAEPSDVNANSARRVHWHECYGELWKLKVAFEKEHNRKIG